MKPGDYLAFRNICRENSTLDVISRKNWERISEQLHDPTVKIDLPTQLELREAIRLTKQTLVEYISTPSLADYLTANTMIVSVNEILSLSEKMPYPQPFTLGMAKENFHVDFLVLINTN